MKMTYAQLILAYQETGNQHFLDRLSAAQAVDDSYTPKSDRMAQGTNTLKKGARFMKTTKLQNGITRYQAEGPMESNRMRYIPSLKNERFITHDGIDVRTLEPEDHIEARPFIHATA
jgi:hypothetical protein